MGLLDPFENEINAFHCSAVRFTASKVFLGDAAGNTYA